MAFNYEIKDAKRLKYVAGGTSSYEVPKGNLYKALNILTRLEVNIASSAASNIPSHQIMRAIQRFDILKGTDSVWSISGEGLSAYFTNRNGVAAKSNTTLSGAVGTDKVAQHYLHCPFAPIDALKPWDFLLDTRKHDYTIEIVWRDVTAAGTLFGDVGGGISVVEDECYVDIELEKLGLKVSGTGVPDRLENEAPLMRGLKETRLSVVSDNDSFEIDVPSFKTFRNIVLMTSHMQNPNQEVLTSDVFNNKLKLQDTQDNIYHNQRATFTHERTSQITGLGANLDDGIYMLDLTAFGALSDVIASDQIVKLAVLASVKKKANETYVRAIFDTVIEQ